MEYAYAWYPVPGMLCGNNSNRIGERRGEVRFIVKRCVTKQGHRT